MRSKLWQFILIVPVWKLKVVRFSFVIVCVISEQKFLSWWSSLQINQRTLVSKNYKTAAYVLNASFVWYHIFFLFLILNYSSQHKHIVWKILMAKYFKFVHSGGSECLCLTTFD
jgi:hypothetical protein